MGDDEVKSSPPSSPRPVKADAAPAAGQPEATPEVKAVEESTTTTEESPSSVENHKDAETDPPAPVENEEVAAVTLETTTEAASEATPSQPAAQETAEASSSAPSTPESAPTPPPKPAAPAPRRPKPPTRGILKPPPPPAKPTLGNRLRDMVSGVAGEAPGPSSRHGSDAVNAAVGTLNAISGRLGLFHRFANKEEAPQRQRQPPRAMPTRAASLGMEPPMPTVPPPSASNDRHKLPLKRATFVLPSISITYPISSQSEPWSAKVLEEREKVESRQRMLLSTASGGAYWTSIRLIKLYESACRGREEKPRLGVIRSLQALPAAPKPRIIHLVLHDGPSAPYPAPYPLEHPLTRYAAEAIADLLTVEWSLSDLRLERGVIETDETLKPILHALLVSGTLPSLSLAGNRKIKASGWRLVAIFLKRARSLRFMDFSDTVWDRKGIEYLVQAINSNGHTTPESSDGSDAEDTGNGENGRVKDENAYGLFLPPAPLLKETDTRNLPPAVETLRMDNCGLRSTTLEALSSGVRTSYLKHISLRHNRIGQLGAVSLAVMIRDYPDTSSAVHSLAALSSASSSATASETAPYATYTPRARRGAPTPSPGDDANLPPIPLVSSSATGGVTSRVVPEGYKPPPPPKHPLVMPGGGYSAMQDSAAFAPSAEPKPPTQVDIGGASLALQRRVRALDGIERIGHLLTLDLKGNDIGRGVTYIAQVLKRNRTLKVLNLSENKIDSMGLVSLAEALKYNSTLETLDVSSNPCCGPGLESISALRMSFTVNNSLKRLFLMDTGLTTEGAIDLAEFIPENRGLLHLDVTKNPAIGTAGILALSSGLKSNKYIRCLDVSIPPNDPNLAELSQSILQSCIRNTELAATALKESKPARAATEALWRPIKKSALVRQVKEADAARAQKEREEVARSVQGMAREYVYRLKPDHLLPAAEDTSKGLTDWYTASQTARTRPSGSWEDLHVPKEDFRSLIERARALTERIAETVNASPDVEHLEPLLTVNDALTTHINNASGFVPPPRILLPSQIAFAAPAAPVVTTIQTGTTLMPRGRRHLRSTSLEILSPNFSIGDSDAESDAEELDSSTITVPPVRVGDDDKKPTPAIQIDTAATGSRKNDAAAECLVEAELAQGLDIASSPVERESRKWVEEEGEIFRKGTRLGVVNSDSEDEEQPIRGAVKRDEMTGEELRQEILETEVPRSPPRQVVELGSDEDETTQPPAADAADGEPAT